MSQALFHIPSSATPPQGSSMIYDLNRLGTWSEGGLWVIDIAPGAEHRYVGMTSTLIHLTEGSINTFSAGDYGGLESGEHVLRNTGSIPARAILMELLGGNLTPGVFQVETTPIENRPLGIHLKALAPQVMSGATVGYEYVELPALCTVTRHTHSHSSALFLVLNGTGYAGRQIEGQDVIEEIGPGSVIPFPATIEHGFYTTTGLVGISGQIPSIETDYGAVTDRVFNYP